MPGSIDWPRTAEYWTVLSGVIFVASFFGTVAYRAFRTRQFRKISAQLAEFIVEGERITRLAGQDPLPVSAHNEWIDRVESYLERTLGVAHKVRFSNFAGLTFFSSGTDRSRLENSISGRTRRLHEFIAEVTTK
jgi:hypothetical protein